MPRHLLLLLIVLVMLALAAPAFAIESGGGDGGTINIMKPEPGTPPAKHRRARKHERQTEQPKGFGVKEDTRRGSSDTVYPAPLPRPEHPLPVPHQEVVTPAPKVPPPLYVPQTGRTLPNLPTIGAGPGGAETSQDRATRCAHQAGVYGPTATGNPNAYIGGCINQ
jgi:hypothetical protein